MDPYDPTLVGEYCQRVLKVVHGTISHETSYTLATHLARDTLTYRKYDQFRRLLGLFVETCFKAYYRLGSRHAVHLQRYVQLREKVERMNLDHTWRGLTSTSSPQEMGRETLSSKEVEDLLMCLPTRYEDQR